MNATKFRKWMESFNRMSRGQRDTLRLQLQGKVTGDEGVKLIEQSLTDVSTYPHCGGQLRDRQEHQLQIAASFFERAGNPTTSANEWYRRSR